MFAVSMLVQSVNQYHSLVLVVTKCQIFRQKCMKFNLGCWARVFLPPPQEPHSRSQPFGPQYSSFFRQNYISHPKNVGPITPMSKVRFPLPELTARVNGPS